MAFEFLFGVFGLISSDSRHRHLTRLNGDWRLFSPLGSSLFREASGKKSNDGNSSSSGSPDKQGNIFSTSGPMTNSSSGSEGIFSSDSSSSASSISSSGISSSSMGSTATLLKPGSPLIASTLGGKKYLLQGEFGGAEASTLKSHSISSKMDAYDDMLDAEGLNIKAGHLDVDSDSTTELTSGEGTNMAVQPVYQGSRARRIYSISVCIFLWLYVFRVAAALVVDKSLFTLDYYYAGPYRVHFLIPCLCLGIQVAAVSLIFIRNNNEANWLVPFYSSKDYLIRSRINFRPRMEDYGRRVKISITLALILAGLSTLAISAFMIHSVTQAETIRELFDLGPLPPPTSPAAGVGSFLMAAAPSAPTTPAKDKPVNLFGWQSKQLERYALLLWLVCNIIWAFYATYICFLVAFYFNLICSIMRARFSGISRIIEDLAESNTSKTTNQARKITTLYLEHNEACELLDESNDFWQYLIFFTYFTYIPAYCYCLYNLFFVDFETWPNFITWVIHFHTGFIILLISFSAAGVSTEAHGPYTSLHTLSLIQLPLDVEVNIATFLHRVRGLTIGYSCYDLFAITNASMSNTAAACASYFLIVADFSRSSVFNVSQLNISAPAALNGVTSEPLES